MFVVYFFKGCTIKVQPFFIGLVYHYRHKPKKEQMKITKQILKQTTSSLVLDFDKRGAAVIASLFSVIFSLSIVLELSNIVSGVVLAFLAVFTTLFLVMNERIKVDQIRKVYKGNKKAMSAFVVTFLISIILSSIGIYFWTNKSMEVIQVMETQKVESINDIKGKFLIKKNDLLTKDYTATSEYNSLIKNLEFWKNKSAATLDERNQIRDHIKDIEGKIDQGKKDFNLKNELMLDELKELERSEIALVLNEAANKAEGIERNDYVTIIFFVMILITEFGIVVLNKDIATVEKNIESLSDSRLVQNYIVARKVLQSLYLARPEKGIVNLKTALYSPALAKTNWDNEKKFKQVKKLYNLFIELGILDSKGKVKNNLPTNKIEMNEANALAKFDNYYEKLLIL